MPLPLHPAFLASALAVEPVLTPGPDTTATRLVGIDRSGTPLVLAAHRDGLDVIDPTTLTVSRLTDHGTLDVAWDGSTLWFCGDDGLWSASWRTADEPVLVDAAPCSRVGVTSIGVWVAGETVRFLGDVDSDLGTFADPLLATDGTVGAVTEAGGDTITLIPIGGTIEAGGPVAGLAMRNGVAAWSIPGAVVDADGAASSVASDPTHLTAGDLDGDGFEDLAVLHPGSVGLLTDVEVLVAADWVELTAVPTTPCASVWGVRADGKLEIITIADCRDNRDDDGDGVSVGEGDCDDGDASVAPGAPGGCDGRDHDCDGVPEWSTSWLPSDIQLVELSETYIDIPDGCFTEVDGTWTLPDGDVECHLGYGWGVLTCTGHDDGTDRIELTVQVGGDVIATATSTVHVENVPPSIDDQTLSSVRAGALLRERLEATDFADPLVFTLISGPEGASVSSEGILTWKTATTDVGEHRLHVSVDDGDGGTDEAWVTVQVDSYNPPACGSGCSATAALFLSPLLRRRRREGIGRDAPASDLPQDAPARPRSHQANAPRP